MRNSITIVLFLTASLLFGQQKAQRKVLFEEFTQASCAPCGSVNPGLNALLHSPENSDRIIPIKYQVWWPGFDPMYLQNPADVDVRVALYDVPSVPDGVMDGNVWHGFAGDFTQAMIDDEYAVPAPMSVSITHTLSPDIDSVFITFTITADAAYTGNVVGHVVLIERTIAFPTAPGTNGETEFFDVMKKMLPDANGTTLAGTWAVGDAVTLTFAVPLPSWYYNLSEIAVVGFVQDMSNKNVLNAAYEGPIPIAGDPNLDAGILGITIPLTSCSLPIIPTCVLKNFGANTLVSCDVNCRIDNGSVVTQPWTGELAQNGTANVTLAAITSLATMGGHLIEVWTSNPNGVLDWYPMNNRASEPFYYSNIGSASPITEEFTSPTFPPAGFMVTNPDISTTWERIANVGSFGSNTGSAKMDFFSYYPSLGQRDYLWLPSADLSQMTSATLLFDHAYAQYSSNYSDGLEIEVSTDCNVTWNTIFSQYGSVLATAPNTNDKFVPAASEWRHDTVSLTQFCGNSNVMIRFVGVNDWGQNLYVDNINFMPGGLVGVNEVTRSENVFSVYPNPFSGTTSLELTLERTCNVKVSMIDVSGRKVMSRSLGILSQGSHNISIDGSELQQGLYFINVELNGKSFQKKASIIR